MRSVAAFALLVATSGLAAQDPRAIADSATLRLSPRVFTQLPAPITADLLRRGCLVPQRRGKSEPHNVIRGEFAKRGQADWAILCSRSGVSSILVYWKGATTSVAEVGRSVDRETLQDDGNGRFAYTRLICADDSAEVAQIAEATERPAPPIEHHGIGDTFGDVYSTTHYWYRGRWFAFTFAH